MRGEILRFVHIGSLSSTVACTHTRAQLNWNRGGLERTEWPMQFHHRLGTIWETEGRRVFYIPGERLCPNQPQQEYIANPLTGYGWERRRELSQFSRVS